MKKRRTSSSSSRLYVYAAVLFLFFVGAFGALFYSLYDQSETYERSKVEADTQSLSAEARLLLLESERTTSVELIGSATSGSDLRRDYRRYVSGHPEVALVRGTSGDVLEWSVGSDSLSDILSQAGLRDTALVASHGGSSAILYSKTVHVGKDYYFASTSTLPRADGSALVITILYSAENLLRVILARHPMQGYEVSLFSGAGRAIASTGFSNAPAPLRVQRGVEGYGRLLSVDVSNPNYSFWTFGMAFAAALCLALSVVVFVLSLGLQRDVVRLNAAESSLRNSEERFRAIFENSVDAMRLMDRYGRIVMVNSSYCDLVNKSYEELLREYNSGDANLDTRYSANSAFRAQFDAGTLKMPTSQTMKRQNGEEVPVEMSHSFIELAKNEKVILSIFRDVSDRKRYEIEAQQVQKMDALGAFAVGIGNNLKNIVGIVMNSAEVMTKEAQGNAVLTQYVEMILRESKRASELADDLLVFARSKASEVKPILVEKIVNQVQKILQHSLAPNVRLSMSLDDKRSVVIGDIHQLHQAVVNVVLAAEHRMPKGGDVRIETAIADPEVVRQQVPAAGEKEFLVVRISDNGQELDEYSRRRIFEPFFSSRGSEQGTGLRLSVVYGIVQHHGGFVDVVSERGKGTIFSLFFPVSGHDKVRDLAAAAVTPHGGSECLLIVDDEESFRQIYEHGLTSFGYRVYTAQDGKDALAVYEKHKDEIALVVTDLVMPNVDGEELFRKLRELQPSVKVIFATGAIDLKARTVFLAMGVRDIIEKPFLLDELILSVRKALDAH